MRIALVGALLLPATAFAGWPEDVTLSSMTEHGGVRVGKSLHDDYLQLVRELGTAVSNKPLEPAETLGAAGFDLSINNTFVFISSEGDDGPSPWQRATVDEDPSAYLFVPQISARKGLPMSMELGLTAGWVGMSRQGIFGGEFRGAIVEGYKPWPDLTFHVGYMGYVGNDELELGVLDLGATFGSTFAFGSFPGIRSAQFAPYASFSMLRIGAHPVLDEETATALGTVPVSASKDSDSYEPAMVMPQFGVGFQITNGTLLFRIAGTWTPQTVPTLTAGMGFSY